MRYDLTSALTCNTLDLPVFGDVANGFNINNWSINIRTNGNSTPVFSGALGTSILDNGFVGASILEFEFLYSGTTAANDTLFFGQGDTSKPVLGGGAFGVSGVPEPGSMAFLGMVLVATGFVRRRN